MSKEMTVVPSSLKLKVYLFALKPDEEFCLKMNFSEGDVGEGGCEGCLQVAWLSACSGVDLGRSILVLPAATRGPQSPPLSSFPCHSPSNCHSRSHVLAFSLTLLICCSASCSPFPFCPAGLLLLLVIIFFFLYCFYLSPQSSRCHCRQFPCVTASFKHHILLQDTDTSDSACPPSPLCRLYITSYLNSQLFS